MTLTQTPEQQENARKLGVDAERVLAELQAQRAMWGEEPGQGLLTWRGFPIGWVSLKGAPADPENSRVRQAAGAKPNKRKRLRVRSAGSRFAPILGRSRRSQQAQRVLSSTTRLFSTSQPKPPGGWWAW